MCLALNWALLAGSRETLGAGGAACQHLCWGTGAFTTISPLALVPLGSPGGRPAEPQDHPLSLRPLVTHWLEGRLCFLPEKPSASRPFSHCSFCSPRSDHRLLPLSLLVGSPACLSQARFCITYSVNLPPNTVPPAQGWAVTPPSPRACPATAQAHVYDPAIFLT